MSSSRRAGRLRRAGAAAALSVTALVGVADGAHAAGGYRFWGYAHLKDGKWVSASTGPDKFTPADGSVEGWRFALTAGTTPRMPRATPSFDTVCGSTAAQTGKKRVALVIDTGRAADAPKAGTSVPAPSAKCVVVDTAATGAQVLAAGATVRQSKGLTCAIDSYPASGCGDAVPDSRISSAAKAADTSVDIPVASSSTSAGASPSASASDSSSGSSAGRIWTGVGIVAVLAALAALALRARRPR